MLKEVERRLTVCGLPRYEEERQVEFAAVCERAENTHRDRVVADLLDHVMRPLFEIADKRGDQSGIADANKHDRRLGAGTPSFPTPDHTLQPPLSFRIPSDEGSALHEPAI